MEVLKFHLEEINSILWSIKDRRSNISVIDLIEFYKNYHDGFNLVEDAINSLVQGNGSISDEEVQCIVSGFRRVNGVEYSRLIVDTLVEMRSKEADRYLGEILCDKTSVSRFAADFSRHPEFDRILSIVSDNFSSGAK